MGAGRRIGAALVVVAVALAVPGWSVPSAGARDGMTVLCDTPGYGCVAHTGYRGQGVWGANHGRTGHNCTSYVSYRLAQLGVAQPWRPMGDAGRWDDNGRQHVRVDDQPAVGAVAQWDGGSRIARGPSGHVAYVEAVTASWIELTDDSYGGDSTRRFRIDRGSPYWPHHFLHIRDLVSDQPLAEGEWELARPRVGSDEPATVVTFGEPGDIPVVGDWDGDGDDTVGTFRDGVWTLTNAHKGSRMKPRSFRFGEPGDIPVVGDWDGDGKDTVGTFRDGVWRLARTNSDDPEVVEVRLGTAGDVPVVGDWDGDGRDTFGVFRDGEWTLTDSPFASVARLHRFTFGAPGDRPVVGDWDGVRGDTVGVHRGRTFVLTGENETDPKRTRTVEFGTPGAQPIAGSWTRAGNDTVGTVR